jgi:hypothetical protein
VGPAASRQWVAARAHRAQFAQLEPSCKRQARRSVYCVLRDIFVWLALFLMVLGHVSRGVFQLSALE